MGQSADTQIWVGDRQQRGACTLGVTRWRVDIEAREVPAEGGVLEGLVET